MQKHKPARTYEEQQKRKESLTFIYYSPNTEKIALLYGYYDGTLITIDFETTRTSTVEKSIRDFLLNSNYHLIGAFYEG